MTDAAVTLTCIVDTVLSPYVTSGAGTIEQKLIATALASKTKKDREKICVLLSNAPQTLQYKVGHPFTVRGRYLMHGKDGLTTVCPDTASRGFVRYDGKVITW